MPKIVKCNDTSTFENETKQSGSDKFKRDPISSSIFNQCLSQLPMIGKLCCKRLQASKPRVQLASRNYAVLSVQSVSKLFSHYFCPLQQ